MIIEEMCRDDAFHGGDRIHPKEQSGRADAIQLDRQFAGRHQGELGCTMHVLDGFSDLCGALGANMHDHGGQGASFYQAFTKSMRTLLIKTASLQECILPFPQGPIGRCETLLPEGRRLTFPGWKPSMMAIARHPCPARNA